MSDKKIAIYSRKSKFTGKGESIDNQIEMCKKKINYEYDNIDYDNDVIIYEDEGYTGYNMKRPAFQRLLNDIKNNKIKTLVFYRLDRVSRNVNDFSNLLNEFDKYNVQFFSVTENYDNTTPSGRAMIMVVSVFAQLERDTIAERIRDNMLELAKTGRWLGGTTPIGYKSEKVDKIDNDGKKRSLFKLDIIDDEISRVQLIFKKFLELKSQTKLETYLLNNDIKTKNGKYFNRFSLKSILENPVYAIADNDVYNYFSENEVEVFTDKENFNGKYGIMAYNKTEQKGNRTIKRDITEWIIAVGKHKGIIEGKDWVEVQDILFGNRNKRYRMPQKNNALLSGIIRCSHCNSFMRPKIRTNFYKENEPRFVYMCELKEKSRKGKCQCKDAPGNEIDEQIISAIKNVVKPSSYFYKKLKKAINDNFNNSDNSNNEITVLQNQLKKNEQDINNLLEKIRYIDLDLLDDVQKQIKELKNTNVDMEKRIKELSKIENASIFNISEQAQIVLSTIDNYIPNFDNLDILQKRTLIKMLISSVETNGEDLIINFVGSRNTEDTSLVPLGEDCK